MPVIDKPSFLRTYAHLMDHNNNLDVIRAETPFMSLLFAVFACAANLVQDPRLAISERHDDGGMGMVYYERCAYLLDSFARWDSRQSLERWFSSISAIRTSRLHMSSASF